MSGFRKNGAFYLLQRVRAQIPIELWKFLLVTYRVSTGEEVDVLGAVVLNREDETNATVTVGVVRPYQNVVFGLRKAEDSCLVEEHIPEIV